MHSLARVKELRRLLVHYLVSLLYLDQLLFQLSDLLTLLLDYFQELLLLV